MPPGRGRADRRCGPAGSHRRARVHRRSWPISGRTLDAEPSQRSAVSNSLRVAASSARRSIALSTAARPCAARALSGRRRCAWRNCASAPSLPSSPRRPSSRSRSPRRFRASTSSARSRRDRKARTRGSSGAAVRATAPCSCARRRAAASSSRSASAASPCAINAISACSKAACNRASPGSCPRNAISKGSASRGPPCSLPAARARSASASTGPACSAATSTGGGCHAGTTGASSPLMVMLGSRAAAPRASLPASSGASLPLHAASNASNHRAAIRSARIVLQCQPLLARLQVRRSMPVAATARAGRGAVFDKVPPAPVGSATPAARPNL